MASGSRAPPGEGPQRLSCLKNQCTRIMSPTRHHLQMYHAYKVYYIDLSST